MSGLSLRLLIISDGWHGVSSYRNGPSQDDAKNLLLAINPQCQPTTALAGITNWLDSDATITKLNDESDELGNLFAQLVDLHHNHTIAVANILRQATRYYFATTKELMQLNGMILTESISGATTLRAFSKDGQFFSKIVGVKDKIVSLFFHSFSTNEWLTQCLEILCALVLSSSALTLTLHPFTVSTSGCIRMTPSYGLSLTINLVGSVPNLCTLANMLVPVEWTEPCINTTSEADEIIDETQPLPNWPLVGAEKAQGVNINTIAVQTTDDISTEKVQAIMLLAGNGSSLSFNKTHPEPQCQAPTTELLAADGVVPIIVNKPLNSQPYPHLSSHLSVPLHTIVHSGNASTGSNGIMAAKTTEVSTTPITKPEHQ
ncbi:hypothetical protein Nepgr_009240 [Nepenthes gracilis]|uniref:Uncharacterized protein n=1 Tax=Nepenthes gracilis TaxID=150966 RepID=A0AAD3SA45_NEPGR|nr:hypothetical protein Nepgr_009240 [Nepenthes gracilis]